MKISKLIEKLSEWDGDADVEISVHLELAFGSDTVKNLEDFKDALIKKGIEGLQFVSDDLIWLEIANVETKPSDKYDKEYQKHCLIQAGKIVMM